MKVIQGTVFLSSRRLRLIPVIFKGIHVKQTRYQTGSFIVESNNLKNLQNSPAIVDGDFECGYQDLQSFIGGPEHVKGDFNCSSAKCESLEGLPKKVGRDFIWHRMPVHITEDAIRAVCDIKDRVIF